MARPTFGLVAASVFALALAAPSGAEPIRPDTTTPTDSGGAHVVNGVLTPLYPAVGALLLGGDPETARSWCTGTLIGCQSFLTAAHCVCGDTGAACQGSGAPDASGYLVFLQHAGFFRIAQIAVHPDYRFPRADLALVTLATPVTGVAPAPVNTVGTPAGGTSGTIVGFGRTGGDHHDYGLKRLGRVLTDDPGSSSGLVSWHFAEPFGLPGSNSNTCNGDSGGPLFVDFGAGDVLAGVTSGGNNRACLADDVSFDTDVFAYRDWVEGQFRAEGGATCGDLSNVGAPGTTALAFSGELNALQSQETHWFEVPARTSVLRVALNGVHGMANFDLSVQAGEALSFVPPDCRQDGSGQYGVCAFDAPVPGIWRATVERVSGDGTYQLNVATFGATGAGAGTEASARCDAAPPIECRKPRTARNASLLLRDTTPDHDDALTWRWTKGAAATKEDFGDPTSQTEFVVCMYRHGSDGSHLIMEQIVPAGAGWTEFRRGFRYLRRAAKGGIDRVVMKAGADGRAAIVVEGTGEELGLRNAGTGAGGRFSVELRNATTCWKADYRGGLSLSGNLSARSN